jgi:hypothetical protein
VPSAVVTLRVTLLGARAGATAVIVVSSTTVNDVAASGPNLTAVAPVKPCPVMATLVPPKAGPELGAKDAMEATGRTARSSAEALMRPTPQVFDGVAESHTPPGKAVA